MLRLLESLKCCRTSPAFTCELKQAKAILVPAALLKLPTVFTSVHLLAAMSSAIRSIRYPPTFLFHPKQYGHHRGLGTVEAFCTWTHFVGPRDELSISFVVYIVLHFWFSCPVCFCEWFKRNSKPKLELLSHLHWILSGGSILISSEFCNLAHS